VVRLLPSYHFLDGITVLCSQGILTKDCSLAVYVGAAASFDAVAKAAAEAGLFSRDLYIRLSESLESTEREVQEKLEPLFRKIYPGEMTPDEFHKWKCNESLRRWRKGEDLTDEEMIGPEHVERWNLASCLWEEQFHDLKEARRMLLRRARSNTVNPIENPSKTNSACHDEVHIEQQVRPKISLRNKKSGPSKGTTGRKGSKLT
jgi:hypothetical protein